MSLTSIRDGMSVYTVGTDAAPDAAVPLAAEEGAASGQESTRSLVNALCHMDFDQLSDEALHGIIKKTLRTAVCKSALALKTEIVEDLELEKMETSLRKLIQRMKIYLNTFTETQKFETGQRSRDPEYRKVIERRKTTTMENIALMMAEVKEIENRISASESVWECFRENYKKEMIKVLKKKMKDFEEGVSSVRVITWEDFVPKIVSENGEHSMTYYE